MSLPELASELSISHGRSKIQDHVEESDNSSKSQFPVPQPRPYQLLPIPSQPKDNYTYMHSHLPYLGHQGILLTATENKFQNTIIMVK